MTDGEKRAIKALMKQCREAIGRARTFRAEATEYTRLACYELDKATGYLKQAEILARTNQ